MKGIFCGGEGGPGLPRGFLGLGDSFTTFPEFLSGRGIGSEVTGLEPVSIWNACVANSGLTCGPPSHPLLMIILNEFRCLLCKRVCASLFKTETNLFFLFLVGCVEKKIKVEINMSKNVLGKMLSTNCHLCIILLDACVSIFVA